MPTPTAINKFAGRTNALTTTDTLNPHLSRGPAQAVPSGASAPKRPRIALSTQADPKDYAYRYMFEKVSERAEGASPATACQLLVRGCRSTREG